MVVRPRAARPGPILNAVLAALAVAAAVALTPATAAAQTTTAPAPASPTAACTPLSPIAAPCTLLGKFADAAAAECRAAGVPDTDCTLPLAHVVTQHARDAYLQSAVHRAAVLQYRLGDALPLGQAPWVGTHNSFNAIANGPTLSRSDSNQQLTLTQQLDVDVRSIELDLHYLPRAGGRQVIVCHGQGPDSLDAGCTTEPPFTQILPEVVTWLNAPGHENEVLLLYLEDEMKSAAAYASAISTLDTQLRGTDGRSLIYRPDAAARAANGCTPLPLDVTRAQVRASGARVILVGSCAKGWAGDVFDWNADHVESGSVARYRPYPACDASYARATYHAKLVRYYEDSTLVATVVDPTRAPVDPEALTPAKVAAMTACGVNLFGFDQLLPDDGRLAATIWSWADGQPAAPGCARQRGDGRWATGSCAVRRRAACVTPAPSGVPRWRLTRRTVTFAQARKACWARGARFAVPRSGLQNAQLRDVARPGEGVWVAYRVRRAR
ncbi:hypothetical protein NBH00_07965 [Paraconexibacter antarcticus]|uniref:Phosphatidylinositol diacylglycerol-lyase n=1 Tax=Paraconexibacter antarcticus TaxID=2949664 RepID=A0ABY5DVU7_9ACTN|nr:hypothetical protein [Paraconexibacter antarcticus]UTI66128.1 hypothetical protein NBH00_07965 [Paraconexibacter antarcticus]